MDEAKAVEAIPEGESASDWKTTSVYRCVDGEWLLAHANWSLVKNG